LKIGGILAEKFKIQGGECLKGEVSIGGAKNSVLKLLAASILVKGCTKIYNVPELTDVTIMLQVLSDLGAKLVYDKEDQLLEVK
jgi:UDP-N-acetylglucosamine 1-carboxyvinyltransferase